MKREELKIFVGPITNLADARFYAAFEFDYLVFDIRENAKNKVDLALFAEIKEWITGVKFACIAESFNENFDLFLNENQLKDIKQVNPNELTTFDFSDKTFMIDLSNYLATPVAHYDFIGDWFDAHFEE